MSLPELQWYIFLFYQKTLNKKKETPFQLFTKEIFPIYNLDLDYSVWCGMGACVEVCEELLK